jgi:hypothetical protein
MPPKRTPLTAAAGVDLLYHLEQMIAEQRRYLEAGQQALEKIFAAQLAALQLATDKATSVLDERFDKANEIARIAKNDRDTFARLTDVATIQKDIVDLRQFQDRQRGAASQSDVGRVQVYAIIGVALSLVSIVLAVIKLVGG